MQHLADCLNRHTAAMDRQTESNNGIKEVLTGSLHLLKEVQNFIQMQSNILTIFIEAKKSTDNERYQGKKNNTYLDITSFFI